MLIFGAKIQITKNVSFDFSRKKRQELSLHNSNVFFGAKIQICLSLKYNYIDNITSININNQLTLLA